MAGVALAFDVANVSIENVSNVTAAVATKPHTIADLTAFRSCIADPYITSIQTDIRATRVLTTRSYRDGGGRQQKLGCEESDEVRGYRCGVEY